MTKIETVPARPMASPSNLPLSISVITLNEGDNLERCLDSVSGLGSEIVIVDSGSTDRTCEIAARYQARVIHNDWPGHVAQKNVALDHCTQPWVLSLDADEALDETLRDAILRLFEGNPEYQGYQLNRLTWFLGDWMRHAWHPEWRLRLVCRDGARWAGMDPHDYLTAPGRHGRLDGYLVHYSFRDLAHHVAKMADYGRISGGQLIARGRHVRARHLLFSPIWRFIKVLFVKGGWRDGWRGVLIAYTTMMAGVLKYAFALEARRVSPPRNGKNSSESGKDLT